MAIFIILKNNTRGYFLLFPHETKGSLPTFDFTCLFLFGMKNLLKNQVKRKTSPNITDKNIKNEIWHFCQIFYFKVF